MEQLSYAIDIKRDLRNLIRTVHGDEIFMVPTTVVDPTATDDVTLMFETTKIHLNEHPELLDWNVCLY